MPGSRLEKIILRGGRQSKPAGYSFLTRQCNPEEKLRITRYLTGCRAALVEDLGGEEALSAQKIILVDRCISLLGVVRGIEEFFKEDIMTNIGELKPALGKNYLSYVNSCRLILCSLGLERQSKDANESVLTLIRKFDDRQAEKEAKENAIEAAEA